MHNAIVETMKCLSNIMLLYNRSFWSENELNVECREEVVFKEKEKWGNIICEHCTMNIATHWNVNVRMRRMRTRRCEYFVFIHTNGNRAQTIV